ncbi:MAG: DUF502 domain-containing protein [Phycisphaerales bacterium JB039]
MSHKHHHTTFTGDFKRFFGRGLAVLLPSILTIWILVQAFIFVFNTIAEPINTGIRLAVIQAADVAPWLIPDGTAVAGALEVTDAELEQFRATQSQESRRFRSPGGEFDTDRARTYLRRLQFSEFWSSHWYLAGTGLVVAIILIYLAGVLLGGLIGRRVYARVEKLIARIPGFKQVYPHVKQLVDLVMGERPIAFNRVVLVEYPREGLWTVGFVTGSSLSQARKAAGGEVLSVFIPSTPAPFTGFTITVRARDAIDLPLSIDEAIRFIITGGALVPGKDTAPAGVTAERVRQALQSVETDADKPDKQRKLGA